nr:hypothetical protein Iba_scaffold10422CG0010 [Ipomoea batatas]GME14728.1 hypothetical protein Iba_scaffold15400CG0420 [Ipomoea batatas]
MKVYNEEESVVLILHRNPIFNGTKIIPKVYRSRWLYTRDYSLPITSRRILGNRRLGDGDAATAPETLSTNLRN